MYDGKIIELESRSWAGWDPSAIHYFGVLRFYNNEEQEHKRVKLVHPMTKKEAEIQNKREDTDFWEEGEITEKFFSEDLLIEEAVKRWREHFPDAKALAIDLTLDPSLILDADDKEFKKQANLLYKQADKINFWANEKKMNKIAQKWDLLIEKHIAVKP